MKTRVMALAASLAATLVAPVHPSAQSRPPVFRSSARLVQVSVVVQDRNGRPVHGYAMHAQLFTDGLVLNHTITLQPQARMIIVGVRDLNSGIIGTVRMERGRLQSRASR